MKRTLSLLVISCLPLLSRADVLVERLTQSQTRTGQGLEQTVRLKGWVVTDLDGTNGAAIATATVNGQKFYIVDRTATRVFRTTLDAGNGREYGIVAQGETQTNEVEVLKIEALLSKGLMTTVQVSESRQIDRPRVLRGSASRLELNGGSYRLDQATSTRIFSQSETQAANALGRDVEAVVAGIIQKLEQAGYVNAS